MLTKEEFCSHIEDIKKYVDFDDKVYDSSRKIGIMDGIELRTSALCNNVIDLLCKIMDDENDDISFFCWELDFGRKWEEGCMVDEDDNDIDLSSSENLYDYLISVMK